MAVGLHGTGWSRVREPSPLEHGWPAQTQAPVNRAVGLLRGDPADGQAPLPLLQSGVGGGVPDQCDRRAKQGGEWGLVLGCSSSFEGLSSLKPLCFKELFSPFSQKHAEHR